jgi:hypothetical protein
MAPETRSTIPGEFAVLAELGEAGPKTFSLMAPGRVLRVCVTCSERALSWCVGVECAATRSFVQAARSAAPAPYSLVFWLATLMYALALSVSGGAFGSAGLSIPSVDFALSRIDGAFGSLGIVVPHLVPEHNCSPRHRIPHLLHHALVRRHRCRTSPVRAPRHITIPLLYTLHQKEHQTSAHTNTCRLTLSYISSLHKMICDVVLRTSVVEGEYCSSGW